MLFQCLFGLIRKVVDPMEIRQCVSLTVMAWQAGEHELGVGMRRSLSGAVVMQPTLYDRTLSSALQHCESHRWRH
jgi:hypothetical protein